LTEMQVRRLLGLETRFEVHTLLKEHKVPLHYTQAELEEDLTSLRILAIVTKRAASFTSHLGILNRIRKWLSNLYLLPGALIGRT
jgi:hypothetical protein